MQKTIAVIGGGAAGFFSAIACAETNRKAKIILLEKSRHLLSKVRISGGGRCNLTYACFDPRELVVNYPRGSKELLGPFHSWQPSDTVDWFESKGVALKTEEDGRIFPTTDSSSTIVDCLIQTATELGVEIRTQSDVCLVSKEATESFTLSMRRGETLKANRVIITSGGGAQSGGLEFAKNFGHTITEIAPSLFSFHIDDSRIKGLEGISVRNARIKCDQAKVEQLGPVLVTHLGLSGPAILKLSAWGARSFARLRYCFEIQINWLDNQSHESVQIQLINQKQDSGRKSVFSQCPFVLPRRIWERLAEAAGIESKIQWAQLNKEQVAALTGQLIDSRFQVSGKTMNKEEFVTCGGVRLGEIDFGCMESKRVSGLFFAGEVMDIDGVTGGFNFQAAWTTGRIAGTSVAKNL
jgi:predicted Rossmann fold flavoprotein